MLIKGGRAVDWYHRYTIGYSDMDIWDLWTSTYWRLYNILKAIQYGRHFADDIFKCISLNENIWTSLKLSLKCVPKVPIDHIPACDIYQWRIYASFGLNELTKLQIAIKQVSSERIVSNWLDSLKWHWCISRMCILLCDVIMVIYDICRISNPQSSIGDPRILLIFGVWS